MNYLHWSRCGRDHYRRRCEPQLLRKVREGRSFVVTSHGKPVPKLVPVAEDGDVMMQARRALLNRLRKQKAIDIGPWKRSDLHDDPR